MATALYAAKDLEPAVEAEPLLSNGAQVIDPLQGSAWFPRSASPAEIGYGHHGSTLHNYRSPLKTHVDLLPPSRSCGLDSRLLR